MALNGRPPAGLVAVESGQRRKVSVTLTSNRPWLHPPQPDAFFWWSLPHLLPTCPSAAGVTDFAEPRFAPRYPPPNATWPAWRYANEKLTGCGPCL